MQTAKSATAKNNSTSFDPEVFLNSAGVSRAIIDFRPKQPLFVQGDPSTYTLYIRKGQVRISVVSNSGKEAVVAMLGQGDFVGEGALAGHPLRMATATALSPVTALQIDNKEMLRVLHTESAFSDRFIAYILERNIRIEEDLIDQLFNSSEKRLARTLLLLARYGKQNERQKVLATITQETLAEIVGPTRSRVSLFMNKFKKLGFITNDGGLHINTSLLSIVLQD